MALTIIDGLDRTSAMLINHSKPVHSPTTTSSWRTPLLPRGHLACPRRTFSGACRSHATAGAKSAQFPETKPPQTPHSSEPANSHATTYRSVALKMEDPATEVEGVVRALVDKPTLQRQAETLNKYATNDVEFYHFYANLNTGLRALIATYQAAQLFLNYSGVDFHNIVYDASRNDIAVRATVYIRPWLLLWRTVPLQLFILLELEDVIVNGKTVKKIRVQRDYFIRAPSVQFLPIVGEIYNSETLRFVWGNTLALVVQFFQWLVTCLFPAKYWQAWLGLDSSDVAFRAD